MPSIALATESSYRKQSLKNVPLWEPCQPAEAHHWLEIDGQQDDLTARYAIRPILAIKIPSGLARDPHPEVVAGLELNAGIKVLMDQGLSQAEVARQLGVARQTVSNHLKRRK
ncbi:helix-turn-helix domain-containing protein [Pseudomonas fluorescens]|uniref:helix-turn-helix domain-containing protein n=1 Tax=Pseudomonas fluorescens TaxID=294 RepID=UPI0009C00066